MDRNQIICLFSPPIRKRLSQLSIDFSNLYEIRLRIQGPLLLVYRGEEFFLGDDGKLCREERQAYHVSAKDIQESLEHIAGYSLYAYEDEIRQGLEQKLDALVRHELYAKYKTAPSAEEREQARQAYLDRRGVFPDFRW